MTGFADKLSRLCASNLAETDRSPEAMGEMIERLASTLGFVIAMAARGNPEVINDMLIAAEAHAHNEAVDKAPFARAVGPYLKRGDR